MWIRGKRRKRIWNSERLGETGSHRKKETEVGKEIRESRLL